MKSLARGLEALDYLVASGSLGTKELAEYLNIDKGSASRLLQTLEASGYASRGPRRRYRPAAPGSAAKALAIRPTIKQRARPLLEHLVTASGESAHLAVRADDQVLYLDRAVPDVMLRADRPVGTLAPLEATALGRVFLAFGNVLLPAMTTELENRLRHFRSTGYAEDNEEFSIGVRCVAAPLRDGNGDVVAAISISGPSVRFGAEKIQVLGKLIVETANLFGNSEI